MSCVPDKRWMTFSRRSPTYMKGVKSFIHFVRTHGGECELFSCPCLFCKNSKGLKPLEKIHNDLLRNGIVQTYTEWHFHGEKTSGKKKDNVTTDNVDILDDSVGLSDDSMDFDVDLDVEVEVDDVEVDLNIGLDENVGLADDTGCDSGCTIKKRRTAYAYERAREPLYPSCPQGKTALYAAIKLNNIKTQYGFSDNGTTALLELIKELLPDDNTLPSKYSEIKKMIQELGMDYITYDACINDCMLYWKDDSILVKCKVCKEPRYKKVFNDERKLTQVPQKTLRHFPLIARLRRFYSIPWIAEAFLWHSRAKSDESVMRHPVDSSAWRCADEHSEEFANEPRNVTLGISTDGFNPNGCFGAAYSCWPVILCPYNLPPSMCMKREFSMLSLLISGPKAPGKDIDVYLQPLIEELKLLWNVGVPCFDSFTNTDFLLKARLLWAIHDFPALGVLSGCAVHGYYACPTCGEDTNSQYLPYSKKVCYMGHRRWLPKNHKFRYDKSGFNKKESHRMAPTPLSGSEVKERVATIISKKGKWIPPALPGQTRKRKAPGEADDKDMRVLFTRRAILHDLPNWSLNVVPHQTDVMHTEKNITEHLLNTLMGSAGSKDGPSARKDMEDMGIRKKLWIMVDPDTEKETYVAGDFEMSLSEKTAYCTTLKNLRVPTGFSTNLRNIVSITPPELKNFKSHDYHVVMQNLLQLLVHIAKSLPKDLRISLLRISIFFKILCAKVINRDQLIRAKSSLVEAMCVLEKHFPPAFFVISIHLMVHLADEALSCGPVRFRWMYPFERLMKGFKGLVRNKRYIDGSIARGYTLREASLYSMESLSTDGQGTHKHTRHAFLDDDDEFADEMPMSKAKKITLTDVQFEQARKWVLSKYVGLDEWERKYDTYVDEANPDTVLSFYMWLRQECKDTEENSVLWRLVQGPQFKALSYGKYQVNGWMFSTQDYEARRVTQNSGVSMRAITRHRASSTEESEFTYYGVVRQIIELSYMDFEETVFYCDWVRVEDKVRGCKVDPTSRVIKVNLSRLKSRNTLLDEPFILASEASQVFYAMDVTDKGWSVVMHPSQRLTSAVDDIEVPTEYQSALTDNASLEKLIAVAPVV